MLGRGWRWAARCCWAGCISRAEAGRAAALALAGDLAKARRLFDAAVEKSATDLEHEQARIKDAFEETKRNFNQEWRQAVRDISARRAEEPAVVDTKAGRRPAATNSHLRPGRRRSGTRHNETLSKLKAADREFVLDLTEGTTAGWRGWKAISNAAGRSWKPPGKTRLQPLCDQLREVNEAAEKICPAWDRGFMAKLGAAGPVSKRGEVRAAGRRRGKVPRRAAQEPAPEMVRPGHHLRCRSRWSVRGRAPSCLNPARPAATRRSA